MTTDDWDIAWFDEVVNTPKLCSWLINGEPPNRLWDIGLDGPCKHDESFKRNIELPVDEQGAIQNDSGGTEGITANNWAIFAFKSCTSLSLLWIKPRKMYKDSVIDGILTDLAI